MAAMLELEKVALDTLYIASGYMMYELYRGTSLTRKHNPSGPCSRPVPRALWLS